MTDRADGRRSLRDWVELLGLVRPARGQGKDEPRRGLVAELLVAAIAYFLGGLVAGAVAWALGWDHSPLTMALLFAVFGPITLLVERVRDKKR